jgi:phospholipase C
MLLLAAGLLAGVSQTAVAEQPDPGGLGKIGHIVFIYGENRSFDHEYGYFPGADGLIGLPPAATRQRDRDGSVLATLPATWGGVLDSHVVGLPPPYPQNAQIPQAATVGKPNKPFLINTDEGYGLRQDIATRDLYHRFYENQMQIHGGRNDMFAAWADGGGITMGQYHEADPAMEAAMDPMVGLARRYVLADHFFQSAFGGSYLNHQFLICSCTPTLTPAQQTRPKVGGTGEVVVPVSVLDADGVTLTRAASSPASALDGPPKYVASTNLTPLDPAAGVYYTVNTMQPPYPPSGNAVDIPQTRVDVDKPSTTPPSTLTTIGDLLSAAHVSWAWYAGGMGAAIEKGTYNGAVGLDAHGNLVPNFQAHHNPFNYYAAYAPGTAARAEHLRDGGLDGALFIKDIDDGKLPAVAFYKPQGNLNTHTGYTDITIGDAHIADIIENHLMKSPAWKDMVIVVTYDENGGWWDHMAPPRGDMFGPGTRIPAIIISPFARRGTVDHTQYDTTSILRLITHRYGLPVLAGITRRDNALIANGFPAMGDLTAALDLR